MGRFERTYKVIDCVTALANGFGSRDRTSKTTFTVYFMKLSSAKMDYGRILNMENRLLIELKTENRTIRYTEEARCVENILKTW